MAEFSRSGSERERQVVPREEVIRFIRECMRKAGTTSDDAFTVAHHLMISDYRGHFSHGMSRMKRYVTDIKKRITDPTAQPLIVTDFQGIAVVDGKNALGQVVGKFCMRLAIEKARKYGISMVATRGSNHYGICGYYTKMAMDQGLIGFNCSNTAPLMVPTRGTEAALGTNPLSLGMATNGDEFLLDMATTTVALGRIEMACQLKEDIPDGWALGLDRKTTCDAIEAYEASLLLPLGGTEITSSYKGYGLALMVEVLCGILAGSDFGPNIRPWKVDEGVANLGHCFICIDPEVFMPGSKERLSTLLAQLRLMPSLEGPEKPILIPGDPEREHMAKVDRDGGISYHPTQIKISEEFAKQMGVQPMKLKTVI